MEKEKEYLLWFEQMERKDVAIVGGKSSSLGEMTAKTDVPVPYGYATTAYAYRYFIEKTGLKQKMADLIAQLTDVENTALLRDISAKLRKAIMDEEMPKDLQQAITKAYKELGKKVGEKDPYVAVRSSATAEDLPDASFAGQQDTYLNVQGAKMIIQKVKECYASCFTDRAVYYREKQGFDHLDVALSAVIQMMVYSKAAGVMFTVNVAKGENKLNLVQSVRGKGNNWRLDIATVSIDLPTEDTPVSDATTTAPSTTADPGTVNPPTSDAPMIAAVSVLGACALGAVVFAAVCTKKRGAK